MSKKMKVEFVKGDRDCKDRGDGGLNYGPKSNRFELSIFKKWVGHPIGLPIDVLRMKVLLIVMWKLLR